MEGTLQQVFGLIVMVYTNSALVIFISFRDRGLIKGCNIVRFTAISKAVVVTVASYHPIITEFA
jgi:hypothetical protein